MADETGDDPIELRAEVAESRAEIAQRQNQPTPFTSFGPDFPGIYYRARLDGRPIAFEGALDEITGYAANDFLGGRPRWDEIVYPADYPRWQLVSNSLAAGTAKRAEREYRIVHKNGEGRHVHEILRQIIDTNDRPEALEGLIFDISRHRQVDAALEAIHKSTTVTLGEAYFVTLLRELTAALGARWGLVGHLLAPHTDRVRTLAFLGNGQVLDNFEYSLAHTPCERVYAKGACYYPSNVAQRFPQDIQLTEMGVEAYLGVPLRNARGETIGALVVLHDQPMPESDLPPTMIEIFAGRAAAEIERLRADQALRESEARFRRITESVTDYVYNVVVSGGQIVATHHGPGCVAVTGYTETEFEADPYLWIKMVPADDRAAVEDLAQDLLQGGEPQPLVHRIIRKDGSLRVVCNTVVTHRDEAGRLLAYDGLIRDITERHQAEAASRASAARLSRIVDNITDAFYIHDSRGNILDVNENACRMLGYTRAELVGGHLSTIDAEEDRRLMPERMRRLLETGSLIYEGYHTHKNGARIPIEVCVKVVSREGDGMILSFVRDITERRRNAEALNASELRARNFIESSPMGIHLYALHENNRLVFLGANPAAVRLLGFDHAPLIGKTIEEAFPPLTETEVPTRYRQAARDGIPWHTEQITYQDERVVGAYEVIAFQTSPGAMAALFMDIGPRVQTEEQLRRVRHAFEHAGDAFFWIDAEGRVIEFNIEVCRSLGYTREEMLGLSISDFVPHIPQGAWGARWADIKKQGLTRSETHHRRKDGSIFPVELVAFHVDFAGREMIFGIARDITERKRAEEARSHIDAQLRQQQKIEAIGTLAAGVAHEINNPMNAVINYAQLIHNRLPEDSPLRGYAGHIISESERVSEIVRQLLAFSRHDKQSHSPARIQDIVKNTLLLTQAMLRKSQIELEVDVPDDLPSLKCHSQQIQQILLNLITNAVAAIDEQRARVERAMFIRVASRRVDEGGRAYCRTTVSDNGAGIPREIAERIFEPFYATKSRERGTGLGLSISYGIAQDHGGRLWCESDPGEGSRFHLDLPLNNGGSLAVNDAQG